MPMAKIVRNTFGTRAVRATTNHTNGGRKTNSALMAVPSWMMPRSWRITRGAANSASAMIASKGIPRRERRELGVDAEVEDEEEGRRERYINSRKLGMTAYH